MKPFLFTSLSILFAVFITAGSFAAEETGIEGYVPIPYNLSINCNIDIYRNIDKFALFFDYKYTTHPDKEPDYFLTEEYAKTKIENLLQSKLINCFDFENTQKIYYPVELNDPIFEDPTTLSLYFHVHVTRFMDKEEWHIYYITYKNSYATFENLAKKDLPYSEINHAWDLRQVTDEHRQKTFDEILNKVFPFVFP